MKKFSMFAKVILFLSIVGSLGSSCFKEGEKHAQTDDVVVPKTFHMSDEEYEKYLKANDPELHEKLDTMEDEFKKEIGLIDEKVPPPPEGWSLEEALQASDNRPKIYRWLNENSEIEITTYKPPQNAFLLGWRYADEPTPTPEPNKNITPLDRATEIPEGEDGEKKGEGLD